MAFPTYSQVVKQAQSTALAYNNLKRRFELFAKHALDLGTDKSPIPGILVETKLDINYFDVIFVDRRFRFALKTKIDLQGVTSGVISCVEVLPKELKAVTEFSINENGDTNVSPPDAEGTIGCDVRQGA